MVKYLPTNAGDRRHAGSIPGLGRSPGGGHGNLRHYTHLVNLMDREAWWATVHRVAKSRAPLKWEDPLEEGTAIRAIILTW